MKIKDGFVLRQVAGEWMAVATGTRTVELPGIIALSETAAFVWKCLEEERTYKQLKEALLEEFEVDDETAEKDLNEFLKQLSDEGLLENE